MSRERHGNQYIGLMSGTSMDGVDAVLVTFHNDSGIEAEHLESNPYPADLKQKLERLSDNQGTPDELAQADMAVGRCFADTANRLLDRINLSPEVVSAIGSHGQTIRHGASQQPPFTLQIGNPALIAELTGIDTVADFRARDIAAGGQGAPLAPAFHEWCFSREGESRAIVNIGGMANITWLPGNNDPVTGFDTGPGNRLADMWCQKHLQRDFDTNGDWAASGILLSDLYEALLRDEFFTLGGPRSTGRELFNGQWLDEKLTTSNRDNDRPEDVQHTLYALTAETITRGILENGRPDSVYVCGGGAFNGLLMRMLRDRLAPAKVTTTAALGLNPQCVEGAAFAWLARQYHQGEACDLSRITGARGPRILGACYPA